MLQDAVYPIDLRPTDLTVVDSDYNTLIMVAASNAKWVYFLSMILSNCRYIMIFCTHAIELKLCGFILYTYEYVSYESFLDPYG
jgi:hypothetical protein